MKTKENCPGLNKDCIQKEWESAQLSPFRTVLEKTFENKAEEVFSSLSGSDCLEQALSRPYPIITVSVRDSLLCFHTGNSCKQYTISTSRKGICSILNSEGTPLGLHEVKEKYGAGAETGSVFIGRKEIGKKYWDLTEPEFLGKNLVTTRILRLNGLEMEKNRGICQKSGLSCDSFDRFIYIHGSNNEDLIGQPLSSGCVLMRNTEIIELFDLTPLQTLVYIYS